MNRTLSGRGRRCRIAGACGEVEAVSSAPQDPAERRWWHGYFVRAGRLAGLKQLTPPATKARLHCSCSARAQGLLP